MILAWRYVRGERVAQPDIRLWGSGFDGRIRAVHHPNGWMAMGHHLALDGIFWVAGAGAAWRDLPEDFGRWSSVYRQLCRRTSAGPSANILDAANHAGVARDRLQMVAIVAVNAAGSCDLARAIRAYHLRRA